MSFPFSPNSFDLSLNQKKSLLCSSLSPCYHQTCCTDQIHLSPAVCRHEMLKAASTLCVYWEEKWGQREREKAVLSFTSLAKNLLFHSRESNCFCNFRASTPRASKTTRRNESWQEALRTFSWNKVILRITCANGITSGLLQVLSLGLSWFPSGKDLPILFRFFTIL